MEPKPDHDAEITICGQPYLFRRQHDLLRRLEQRFGALIVLARRAESLALTQAELAGIYEEIVRGDPQRPSRATIETWVWAEGTPKVTEPLVRILYELPIGNKTLRLIDEERRIAAAEQEDRRREKAGESARPTQPAGQVLPPEMLQEILTRSTRSMQASA